MTTHTSDPISEIKKTEETSKSKLEASRKELDEKLIKVNEDLAEKRVEFEKNLKEKGNQKLETVKSEAGELYKSKMATSEKGKNQIINSAKEKHDQAVKEIISNFTNYVKE